MDVELPQQECHVSEIDLDEKILVPSANIIFLNRVYELSKCNFLIDKTHIVFAINVPIPERFNKEKVSIQKIQLKIHFKHISKVEILPQTAYDGATCLSLVVSDFAAARFTDTIKRLQNIVNDTKPSTAMGLAGLENRLTCDTFFNWIENEKEIQKMLFFISAASYALKFPNQPNVVTVNDLATHNICFFEKDVFLRITVAANADIAVVDGEDGVKYLTFNNHAADHPTDEDEIVLSDTDDVEVETTKLPNGLILRNGGAEVEVQFLGQRHSFSYGRLDAIAKGQWLSGDDIDFFLHYHYTMILTEHWRRKMWIKPIKFFLDINAKKSVEKTDKEAMEDLKNILTNEQSLKTLKDAGQEFDRPFIVIPVIYKDHWFVAIIVNPAASVHSMEEKIAEKKTSILIMDSLKDSRALSVDDREGIFNVLTWYLYFAKEKSTTLPENTRFNRALVEKIMVQVPQQTNAVDCGVYLIKYVESFFTHLPDPNSMPTDLTNDPPEMFKDFKCSEGRKELVDIVCSHAIHEETGESLKQEFFEMMDEKK